MSTTTSRIRWIAATVVIVCAFAAAAAYDLGRTGGQSRAEAVPVPTRIDARSSVEDVLRFAETSGGRWRRLRAAGHSKNGGDGASAGFEVVAERPDRARLEQDGVTRVRNGSRFLRVDGTGAAERFTTPVASAAEKKAFESRMAAHQANDPTLSRPGERVVDTPVNDLISPAAVIRRELRMAAVSVKKAGTATIAGRPAVVLEARFPEELAKEDHWDVYVDVSTGVLLGMVIEPLPGEQRYETWIDSLEVDPAIEAGLFETAAPGTEGARP